MPAGRYSVIAAVPTKAQVDLLSTTLIHSVSGTDQTLGRAVRYLLQAAIGWPKSNRSDRTR